MIFFSLCWLCCICVPLFFSRFHVYCFLDFAWSLDSVVYWIIPLPCAFGTLLPIFCYIGFMLSNIIVHTICECFIYSFIFFVSRCFYVSWVCVLLLAIDCWLQLRFSFFFPSWEVRGITLCIDWLMASIFCFKTNSKNAKWVRNKRNFYYIKHCDRVV